MSALKDFQSLDERSGSRLNSRRRGSKLQRLLAIILCTDSETTQVFLESLAEELEDEEDDVRPDVVMMIGSDDRLNQIKGHFKPRRCLIELM